MNNVKIRFKKNHIDFLLKHIKNEKMRSKYLQALAEMRIYENSHMTDHYLIDFSNNEIEIMLDELSFLFTSIGVNQQGGVNKEGLTIEDIIDLMTN